MKYSKKQQGISLVELLIATAISLFLIASIFTVYLSNKKTYQYNDSLAHIQENARVAFEWLNHDIHMAGSIQLFPQENVLQITEFRLHNDVLKNFIKTNPPQTIKYYIARDNRGISVLFRKDLNSVNAPSGLIDNINNMKVELINHSVKITLSLGSSNKQLQREWSIVITPRNHSL